PAAGNQSCRKGGLIGRCRHSGPGGAHPARDCAGERLGLDSAQPAEHGGALGLRGALVLHPANSAVREAFDTFGPCPHSTASVVAAVRCVRASGSFEIPCRRAPEVAPGDWTEPDRTATVVPRQWVSLAL